MCGIIGYIGKKRAKEVLLSSLERLEYRGYDSAGIALFDKDEQLVIQKTIGKVSSLITKCKELKNDTGCGMGHTRWATHGGVSNKNAHPHKNGRVVLIHNGIIENFKELIIKYELKGKLCSETDTEVAAAVMNYFYHKTEDPVQAIIKTIHELQGTFAFGIIFTDRKECVYAIRNVSPIVVTHTEGESVLASDITALAAFGNSYFVLPEYHVLEMHKDNIQLYDLNCNLCEPEYMTIDWEMNSVNKEGYPFFMEKEIMEQPGAMRNTIMPRIREGIIDLSADGVPDSLFEDIDHICVIGCGTAMHAGLVAKQLIQQSLKIPVDVNIASEFVYEEPLITRNTLVIAISQSGETIDTLAALRLAAKYSDRILSIVNVKGSTITRESKYVMYTNAGTEIAVASTKAYTVQLCVLYLLFAKLATINGYYNYAKQQEFVAALCDIISDVEGILQDKNTIHKLTQEIVSATDAFYIGRGLDHALILEGSLKLKEVSYIHAEAYSAGELKHGTIALITEKTPVIAVMTQKKVRAKTMSNAIEVRARGARVILIVAGELEDKTGWNQVYHLPERDDIFMTFSTSVVMQLIAYYAALDKGLDVDKPRNLAKVVTVE